MSASPDPEFLAPPDAAESPRSIVRWVGDGAKTGSRLMSYLAVPLAIGVVVVGLVPTAIGLGAGHGVSFHPLIARGAAVSGALEACGLVLGAIVAGFVALARRGRAPAVGPGWWATLNRPIGRRGLGPVPVDLLAPDPASPSRRRAWWRRWERWLVGPAAVVLIAAYAGGMIARRSVDRRLAEAIAAADRDDPNWRFEDLMAARGEIPDDENPAVTVARVVELIPRDWWDPKTLPPGTPPPPPAPLRVALDRASALPRNVRLDDATAATLRTELAEHAEAVDLARTLVEARPGYHKLDLTPIPYNILLPENEGCRDAARFLTADVALRAYDGRIDEALDSCCAILGVGRSIGDEPFLISGLVRIVVGNSALDWARRALGQGEASDAALARLQALILDERPDPLLVRGVRGERASLEVVIRRICDGEVSLAEFGGKQGGAADDGVISSWGKLSLDHQRAVGLEWSNTMVAIAARSAGARPALWRAWEAQLVGARSSPFMPYLTAIPVHMMPAVDPVSLSDARYRAALGGMAILLAAERHRLKHGAWPESIAAIDPAFLADPPLDPYTGEPYRFEFADGQLLVHSVGANLRDEHGAYEPSQLLRGGPDDSGTGAWDVAHRRQPAEESPAPK